MNIVAVRVLQSAIDAAMRQYDCPFLTRIELAKGSEVTDLSLFASLCVHTTCRGERRFTVLAKEFSEWVFGAQGQVSNHLSPELTGIYATGHPIVLVREITGESIVRSVTRYLQLEHVTHK